MPGRPFCLPGQPHTRWPADPASMRVRTRSHAPSQNYPIRAPSPATISERRPAQIGGYAHAVRRMEQAHQRGGHPETFILLDLQRIPLRPGNLAGRPSGRILFPSLRCLSALKVVLQVPSGACGVGPHRRWYAPPVRRAPAAAARTQPPANATRRARLTQPRHRARNSCAAAQITLSCGAGVAAPATSCCLYQAEMAHRRQGPVAFDEVAVAPRASGLARAGQSRAPSA